MKKVFLAIVIIVMLGWVVYEYVISPDTESQEGEMEIIKSDKIGIRKGDIAPDFELTTLDGETIKLSDYRGQRVMLNFWATWCPPCRAEMPDMQKFQEKNDVKVLAVNIIETESNPARVQEFIDEYELTFKIPLDEESTVSETYRIAAYPTTFMIDSEGRIQFMSMGALNYDMMVQQLTMME
ncbi:alkyl hydroperoxide reductase [Lysinibacillus sphaericus]|nr:TlpA disulfide reductase family protein [Lysinibacillus sphaericus]KEK11667.1 alkyl hydroperoxide reductase [Lysinibacillus sphaericus]